MRIVVAGALANKPGYGGEAWVRLSWVLGLRALGAEVLFVEELAIDAVTPERHPGVRFFHDVCGAFGLEEMAALLTPTGESLAGLRMGAALDFAADADLLVNISGHLGDGELFAAVRRAAYVDLDPGFTQLWHAAGVGDLRIADHDVHFTVGGNIGTGACAIPTSGIDWIPILPPVLLDRWSVVERPAVPLFTTVASWRGAYGPPSYQGRSYGVKAHQFRALAELPSRVPAPFEIALDIHSGDRADRRLMEEHGWNLVDPRDVAGSPDAFRDYVAASTAEFSVAQGVYTETRSGWFSDRSAAYLAAGRPVVVQDTGVDLRVPTGEGILTFQGLEHAAEAVREVMRDPEAHARAARQIAEEHFEASVVLAGFLERALPRIPRSRVGGLRERRPSEGVTRGTRGEPKTVLVSGMIARVPGQGGATWAALQYVLGLLELGHDVLFVEEVAPEDLLPAGAPLERSANARYFREVVRRFGLEGRACLLLRETRQTVGVPWSEVGRRLGSDAILLNLSGVLRDEDLRSRTAVQVYVDLDPAFTQLWQEVEGVDMGFDRHTHFVTVGLRVGARDCPVPRCGRTWIPSLPPVALGRWTPGPPGRSDVVTTVANWRSYGSVHWKGVLYGQKAHAFRQLMDVPSRAENARFDLALGIHRDEREDVTTLRGHGWHLLDPERAAGTPERYMRFITDSSTELCVAKTGYVLSQCGWFSDRSACYLARGRPVVAQDTGFSVGLPTGEGLLPFRTAEEAAEGVMRIRGDYRRHARAARRIAEEHLDARRVLGRLIDEVAR